MQTNDRDPPSTAPETPSGAAGGSLRKGVLSTQDYQDDRRRRSYELMKKHSLRVPLSEFSSTEMLERAVIAEMLDKLLDERW
jgi:hypothetical protein